MRNYEAWFAKAASISELEERAGGSRNFKRFFSAPLEPPPGSSWITCRFSKSSYAPDDEVLWGRMSILERDSKQLGEMIYLYMDRSQDSFVYEHSRDGVLLRKLVWFALLDPTVAPVEEDWTPGWLCAQGEPEEWEAGTFFRPQTLDTVIQRERENYADRGEEGKFPGREAEIRRVWESGIITPLSTLPLGDAFAAFNVEKHFGLPRPE